MKTYNNLYPKVCSKENFNLAFKKAIKGKRNTQSVRDFFVKYSSDTQSALENLRQEFINNKWVCGPYNSFYIYEPKQRLITAAPFKDRIIHHALINICESIFEKKFIYNTYACRKGKGTHKAIKKALLFSKNNNYFLKLDIKQYFANIDKEILKKLLLRTFKDKKIIEIFSALIDSFYTTDNKGLPIGNLTSQYFANYYLSFLDHYIQDKLGFSFYIRYMDDFCIWCKNKLELQNLYKKITVFLKNNLGLSLKDKITRLAPVEYGLSFLGFRIFKNKIRLKKETIKRFNKKTRYYNKLCIQHSKNENLHIQNLMAVRNFILIANGKEFLKRFFYGGLGFESLSHQI